METTETDRHLTALSFLHEAAMSMTPDSDRWTLTFEHPNRIRDALDWLMVECEIVPSVPKTKNRDRIDALERGMERLTADLSEAWSEIHQHDGSIDGLAEQIASRKSDNQDVLDATIERLDELNERLDLRTDALESKYGLLSDAAAADSRYHDSVRVRLENEQDGLSDRIRGLSEQIEGYDRATADALAFATADRGVLRRLIDYTTDRVDDTNDRILVLSEQIDGADHDRVILQRRIDYTNDRIDGIADRIVKGRDTTVENHSEERDLDPRIGELIERIAATAAAAEQIDNTAEIEVD